MCTNICVNEVNRMFKNIDISYSQLEDKQSLIICHLYNFCYLCVVRNIVQTGKYLNSTTTMTNSILGSSAFTWELFYKNNDTCLSNSEIFVCIFGRHRELGSCLTCLVFIFSEPKAQMKLWYCLFALLCLRKATASFIEQDKHIVTKDHT